MKHFKEFMKDIEPSSEETTEEEVEIEEGIRDFKKGDKVKFVNDESEFLGQTGKITSLSGDGSSQRATVKLNKGGKSVTNVLVKLDLIKEDDQERQRDAWYKGDEHVAQDKKANPRLYKKVPIKKKGLTIPKGHEIKDKQDRDREAFYKEK